MGSMDAALAKWGKPTPFPNPCLGPLDLDNGARYVGTLVCVFGGRGSQPLNCVGNKG